MDKKEHRKTVKDWERCIKDGLVLTKPKPSDRHIFLNQKRLNEVRELIE